MFTCRTGGRARARRGGSSGLVAQWVPVGGSLVTVVERPAGMRTRTARQQQAEELRRTNPPNREQDKWRAPRSCLPELA